MTHDLEKSNSANGALVTTTLSQDASSSNACSTELHSGESFFDMLLYRYCRHQVWGAIFFEQD